MADRLIEIDPETLTGELRIQDGAITVTTGLDSMVTISLFTDRRAPADAQLPDNTGDRRGWCLTFRQQDLDGEAEEVGSLLWLLSREKQMAVVLSRAKVYAEQALAWMVRRKIVAAIAVTTEVAAPGILALLIEIRQLDGTTWERAYQYYWSRNGA